MEAGNEGCIVSENIVHVYQFLKNKLKIKREKIVIGMSTVVSVIHSGII